MSVGVLAGCDTQQSNGELYLERLANALDMETVPLPSPQLRVFPAPNSLLIERLPGKIGLLEFLQINRCDLGALVGARNSGLGRVQTASQRWIYDARLVSGLQACEGASAELQALTRERRAELGVAAFNALFTGEEWHEFATPPIGPGATQRDAAGIERTLLALNALVAASSRGDPDSQAILKVEDHLAVVRFSYALGVQRRNWVEQSELLERATSMLLRALVTNPACRTGKPTEQGKIRRNIFEQYYVARLQPELARQGQPDRGWVRAVAVLVNSTLAAGADSGTTWPQAEAVERWHQAVLGEHPESEYGRWKYAIAAHTSAWQRQLGLCGLMPGV